MQDMTLGPIAGHLARMAVPIAIGMAFQTLATLLASASRLPAGQPA